MTFLVNVIFPLNNFIISFLSFCCFLEQTWETLTFVMWSHTNLGTQSYKMSVIQSL